jgi:PTH1 family peptidyl-tRNA hydrolase
MRLGTGDFRRLRIGIGRPPGNQDPADFVLATFRPEEREAINAAVAQAAELIVRFVESPDRSGPAGVVSPRHRR